jgi:ADP-ribosylation factor-like protein 3
MDKSVVVLGMEAAGKSLLVGKLRDICNGGAAHSDSKYVTDSTPTIGVEMDTLTTCKPRAKITFEIRELGGIMVQLWQKYFEECGVLVYVIDMAQVMQISATCVELYNVLADPRMNGVPTLLFLNKMDLDTGFTRSVLDGLLRLPDLQRSAKQKIDVIEGSAATGQGVDEVLDWLCANSDLVKRQS